MEQVTVYRAFDGKRFDTEEECLEYERDNYPSSEGLNGLLLFNENTILMIKEPGKTYYDYYVDLGWFVVTKATEESLACLRNILDCGPYKHPDHIVEGHIYKWTDRDGWYDYSKEFCQIKEAVDIIISTVEFNKDLRKLIEQNSEST